MKRKGFAMKSEEIIICLAWNYLKKIHRQSVFGDSSTLNSYLADINEQAEDMFLRLVKHMAECENVTKSNGMGLSDEQHS